MDSYRECRAGSRPKAILVNRRKRATNGRPYAFCTRVASSAAGVFTPATAKFGYEKSTMPTHSASVNKYLLGKISTGSQIYHNFFISSLPFPGRKKSRSGAAGLLSASMSDPAAPLRSSPIGMAAAPPASRSYPGSFDVQTYHSESCRTFSAHSATGG